MNRLNLVTGAIILCTILTAGCFDTGVVNYDSSVIDVKFEANNLTIADVKTQASQHYSVEEVFPGGGVTSTNVELLNSQFNTEYVINSMKVLVPADKKMTDDDNPEFFVLFAEQEFTNMGWYSLPRSNSTYPQDYVADTIKLSFNISDEEAGKYAEKFGENIMDTNKRNAGLEDDIIAYEPMFIPHQPDIGAIVGHLNERGDLNSNPLGSGYYVVDFYNSSLPYGSRSAGSLYVHTGYAKITHNAGNTEYVIMIDDMGRLNVEINPGHDSFSLEDGRVVLKVMFENIGHDAGLVDKLEFGMDVV
ncbi:hypothetical protein [Methanococcoides sp. LMO-2]|uniref:DUF4876 domain-containing protein n=1 Tax=Methanococcoides cohabitans TaxID=3136559 RepID=A0ABU9KT92_9EURY